MCYKSFLESFQFCTTTLPINPHILAEKCFQYDAANGRVLCKRCDWWCETSQLTIDNLWCDQPRTVIEVSQQEIKRVRLATYRDTPAIKAPHITKMRLAERHIVYDKTTDCVVCAKCNWSGNLETITDEQLQCPKDGNDTADEGGIQVLNTRSSDERRPIIAEFQVNRSHLPDCSYREQTFRYWPLCVTSETVTEMSRRGFFYIGIEDIVACYQCLHAWKVSTDDDWKKHTLHENMQTM